MKQWYIITPLSIAAQIALDTDEAQDEDLLTVCFDETKAQQLWVSGIFDSMNQLSPNALIDDYESAEIIDLEEIDAIISNIKNNLSSYTIDLQALVFQILALFEKAKEVQTGVYFFF
jgi:hypothetical protein